MRGRRSWHHHRIRTDRRRNCHLPPARWRSRPGRYNAGACQEPRQRVTGARLQRRWLISRRLKRRASPGLGRALRALRGGPKSSRFAVRSSGLLRAHYRRTLVADSGASIAPAPGGSLTACSTTRFSAQRLPRDPQLGELDTEHHARDPRSCRVAPSSPFLRRNRALVADGRARVRRWNGSGGPPSLLRSGGRRRSLARRQCS